MFESEAVGAGRIGAYVWGCAVRPLCALAIYHLVVARLCPQGVDAETVVAEVLFSFGASYIHSPSATDRIALFYGGVWLLHLAFGAA